jgi:HPt (histidine-containing phosphotransfer) domain-containing protein
MQYIAVSNGFGTHNADNMRRWETAGYLNWANALAGDADRCIESGFNDYLSKPFRQQQIDDLLVRWVQRSVEEAVADRDVPERDEEATASQSADDSAPVLDLSVIELIRDMERRGASRLFERLVRTYVSTSAKLVADLEHALVRRDATALRHASHTLKSSSANLGATQLSQRFGTIERQARAEDLASAAGEWRAARGEYVRVVQALADLAAADETVTTN